MAELSAHEQLLLELINRARLDPNAEAARYGIALNQGLAAGTLVAGARQVLAPDELLVDAARAHSQWMLDNDVFSHTGVGGSVPGDRMADAGYVFSGNWTWGENIAWSGTTGPTNLTSFTEDLHRNLFLSPGHRVNILNGTFRELGNGVLEGQFTQNGVTYNSVMVTENFATSGSDVFVTGVAYSDLDGDAFYDVGEAASGITVTVTSGAAIIGTDTTAAAGGYAVEAGSTNALVTFSGGSLAAPVSVTISGGGANAKVDLVDGDTIFASVSAILGDNALDLRLLGSANINGTGNAANNVLYGNAGNNVLNGLGGADIMRGGLGNDSYWIDSAGDVVEEFASAGTDSIFSSLTVSLGANVENLYLQGSNSIWGLGNSLANVISGNAGSNRFYSYGGNDSLTGGYGNDVFVFNTALNASSNRDVIRDFANVSGNNDRFYLENAVFKKLAKTGNMSSAYFKVGTKAVDSNDFIIYNKSTGALYYDSNANASGGMVQIATLTNKAALSYADFYII